MQTLSIGYESFEILIFSFALMIVLSVWGSRASTVIGVPSLLLFLGIGMLAGAEGPGRIDFSNYTLAYSIGAISLVLILFDGGLRTNIEKNTFVIKSGILLSTVAVVLTALLIGGFSYYVLKMDLIPSLLLGAIVSSTDAAAVFSILRGKNLNLKGNTKKILELEAGSNDPMAIFLTIGVLQIATFESFSWITITAFFLNQFATGLVFGWAGGKAIVWIVNNIKAESDGLYSVLLLGLVLLLFSATAKVGGSGFLAVYIAGLVMAHSPMLKKHSLLLFNDGVAWIAQITLFLVLGLLVYPSQLVNVVRDGVLLAAFMMIIARPVSVFLLFARSKLSFNERLFTSWVGLRGAAPIILAIAPWTVGLPNAEYYFNLVFFVVLISVILQGTSISWVAGKLDLIEPISDNTQWGNYAYLPQDFVNLDVMVNEDSLSVGNRIIDLDLPSGILLLSLERNGRFIVPSGETVFEAGDKILALARPSNLEILKNKVGTVIETKPNPSRGDTYTFS